MKRAGGRKKADFYGSSKFRNHLISENFKNWVFSLMFEVFYVVLLTKKLFHWGMGVGRSEFY